MELTIKDFPQNTWIRPGDDAVAVDIGWISDVFTSDSALLCSGNTVYIQCIVVKSELRNRGHFNALLSRLWNIGFTIKVPNPKPTMVKILKKKNFQVTSEQSLCSDEPDLEYVMFKDPPG